MKNKELINYLKKNNFIPSKKMGQNFLICENYKNAIVNLIDINPNVNIIEIGPGFGSLTSLIYQKTQNIKLIELDKRIHEYLKNKFQNIEIINDNFLDVNLNDFCLLNMENKIISNLPYSISSKAIIKIIKCNLISESILMIQKEVADRIIAKENTKNYNGLSVFIKMICEIQKLFDVPNTVFYPKPIVTSSLIKLIHNKKINFDVNKMEKFIRNCFNQKRKTIFNNLKNYYDKSLIFNSLNDLNIDHNTRPENISIELYKKLFFKLGLN